ncbi:unnamed protein product [Diatraea saccharalis]|uniref:Uncharacterized protein n=1 Tax=Diatraea saccharalis TaxID=40085 RepID=A0A9N9WBK2_9NEOP|nr:unnamed protein product [Diatraea saccharalis]
MKHQRKSRDALMSMLRVARRRWVRTGVVGACVACVLLAAARLLAPPTHAYAAHFARVRPADLAHLLADISANTHPIPGSWSLEEESGNYSMWRYAVSYVCGARCVGHVWVEAHEVAGGGPRHGLSAPMHRVTVRRLHCTALPLLPWPSLCDEVETESVVSGEGDGCRLQETVRARCGAAAALLAACTTRADVRAHSHARLQRLRHLLHAPASLLL